MGNLVINTNKISTNVIPNIKNADTYIKNAKTYATSMYGLLPKDFSSRSTALNIKTEVEYLSGDIEKLLSFFQSKVANIDDIDSKNYNRLHSFADTVNDVQNRNNSFMSINGIYYTEEGLSKELENIMSDDVFKSEVILAICINEQNKSEINKGTVSGFHQLESTQNNFYFTSTEEANKVYNENLKDFIALYNNKWKQGRVPQNEFLNGVKKFFDCQDAYVKYLESDTYYQEQIDTLKKENADCNRKMSAYDNEYNGFTEISCLNGTQSKTEYYTALNKHNEYVEKTKELKEKVNANSDLIAYYTEQLAYSNVEKLYNAERVNVINTKEYNNLSIEDAKAELEEFSICYPDDTNASANDAVAGRCEKVEDIISLGTEEDIKLVCLYSRNHTAIETKKFISAAVSPRINKVFAEQQAKLYESKGSIGRFAQGTGTAIHSGCEGIGNAITGINKMITSDDSYTFAGKNTIALGEIQNIEKCKALNYWYSGVQSAVAQSPGVALSFVPYVGKDLALGYSAAYSAGNTYVEDVNAGKDAKTARSVAIINAGVELGSSALLGAIPVEGALTKSAKSALATTGNRFVRKFMNYAIDTGGEILEEEIQNGLTLGIKNIAYGEHNTYSIESATDTACVTGISTFLLRGGSSAFRRIYNTNINTSNELNLQNNLVTADNIVNNNNNFMFIQPNIDNSVNSVIDNVRNTTNPIPNNTLTNDVHSKVALRFMSKLGFDNENVLNASKIADVDTKQQNNNSEVPILDIDDEVINTEEKILPKSYTYKKPGDRLPMWSNEKSIERGKNTVSSYESIHSTTTTGDFIEGHVHMLESLYNHDMSSPDGIKLKEYISRFYSMQLYSTVENKIFDFIKVIHSEQSKVKINSYSLKNDGTMEVNFSVDGQVSTKVLAIPVVDAIIENSYKDANFVVEKIITQNEVRLSQKGKNKLFKYRTLVENVSSEEVVNEMTKKDIQEYEDTWKNKVAIDETGKKYNFVFFTTQENIDQYAENGHIIGYNNNGGTKTQWVMSLYSLNERLHTMKFNGNVLTVDLIKDMSDSEVQHLVEQVIAVEEGSYDNKKLCFITGDRNITIENMTSNSKPGANDYYTVYGQTAEGVTEADAGAVDINDSEITIKSSMDEIRNVFTTLLSEGGN